MTSPFRFLSLLGVALALSACPDSENTDSGPGPQADAGRHDATSVDAPRVDATAVDSAAADASSPDSTGVDTALADIGHADTPGSDSGPVDARATDTAPTDSEIGDAPATDSLALPDAGHTDTAMPDGAEAIEASVADANASGGDDSQPQDAAQGADAACAEGESRCGLGGVERCDSGGWVLSQPCAQGCADAACSEGPTTCSAGERRCYLSGVERCNASGTAWVLESLCPQGCADALCLGSCAPDARRCNGDVVEICASSGAAWDLAQSCDQGCLHGACVEAGLVNEGLPLTMDGIHTYEGCVDVSLAGEINVPAAGHLEIWARCFTLSQSSSVNLGSGAELIVHLRETADIAGTISGGHRVWIEAYQSLDNSGDISSDQVVLRAAHLTQQAAGSIHGSELAAALYGSLYNNTGSHSGVVSVMPPAFLSSVTHPAGEVWNLDSSTVVVSWPRPFASVMGYYIAVGDFVPGPDNAVFTEQEQVALPASVFVPGRNLVQVVSVNADSIVGTYPAVLELDFNAAPPILNSSSHPDSNVWSDSDDVYLSWTDPPELPQGTWSHYLWAFDHIANTVPDEASGTLRTERNLLLPDRPAGLWVFHIVGVDRMGRGTSEAAHLVVRIGPEPTHGNIAGTITNASGGQPMSGAVVTLNGGLLRAYSGVAGDYTFRGEVPVASEPYQVLVHAPGFVPTSREVLVNDAGTRIESFALEAGGEPFAYRLGYEVKVHDQSTGNPAIGMGPQGLFIWSHVRASGVAEGAHIVRRDGTSVMDASLYEEYYDWGARTDVGFDAGRFWALEYYKCDDNGSLNFGHGWSCLRMKTWDPAGATIDDWLRWRNSGHTGSPSAAYNGDTFGTFFISYSALYHREIDSDISFVNGGDATQVELLASGYADDRQFARTRAIWDGAGYAVAWAIGDGSGQDRLYFGRWGQDLSVLKSAVAIDSSFKTSLIGLAFDGQSYHLAYDYDGATRQIVLRRVSAAGELSSRTVLADDVAVGSEPSLAFDRSHLLVVYERNGEGVLEARRPLDHSLVVAQGLGPMLRPRLSYSADTGEGAIIYLRPDRAGTFVRWFWYN